MFCQKCGGNIVQAGKMLSGNTKFSLFKCEKCGDKTTKAEI